MRPRVESSRLLHLNEMKINHRVSFFLSFSLYCDVTWLAVLLQAFARTARELRTLKLHYYTEGNLINFNLI